MNELLIWVSRAAGIIMSLSYIPQQYKIIKTKTSKGISLPMFIMVMCALLIYESYAFSVKEPVFLFTNTLSCVQTSILLFLIIKYREKKKYYMFVDKAIGSDKFYEKER